MTSPRVLRTPKKTPKSPSKLTPATRRTPRVKAVQSPYVKAKKLLSSSAGETLVGRDDEKKYITEKVKDALEDGKSTVLYVYGPAGTGKTLTVSTVVRELELLHNFKLINMNCMSLETLANFYSQLADQYASSPKKQRRNNAAAGGGGEQQANDLNKIKDAISQYKDMTVLVLDEVDQLKSKNNEVLRSIFQLPALTKNKLILIGISNALDFTSKNVWLKELDKCNLHELLFKPYTKDQISQIIDHRLKSTNDEENALIDKTAVDFCALKIASVSGDIRKALDVCRQAVEMVEHTTRRRTSRALDFGSPLKPSLKQETVEDSSSAVGHVDLKVMMTSINKVTGGIVDKLEEECKVHLPTDQQLILCTLLMLNKHKSMREVKLSECRQYLNKICTKKCLATEGKSESDILTMCQLLSDCGYVSIQNELPLLAAGRSPSKMSPSKLGRTPTKKKSAVLSLRLDPSETEQLLGKFIKAFLAEGSTLLA